jgi:hypothetical protein
MTGNDDLDLAPVIYFIVSPRIELVIKKTFKEVKMLDFVGCWMWIRPRHKKCHIFVKWIGLHVLFNTKVGSDWTIKVQDPLQVTRILCLSGSGRAGRNEEGGGEPKSGEGGGSQKAGHPRVSQRAAH